MSVLSVRESGRVTEIKKSIASVDGLSGYMSGQVLTIADHTKAMVMGFDKEDVSVLFLGRAEAVKVGDPVFNKLEEFRIPVGEGFKARVINALAERGQ